MNLRDNFLARRNILATNQIARKTIEAFENNNKRSQGRLGEGGPLSSRLKTLQFTWSLTPDQKKKALASPQCLSNGSQEEEILAHSLVHFKSLCNPKLTHLIRMGLALKKCHWRMSETPAVHFLLYVLNGMF